MVQSSEAGTGAPGCDPDGARPLTAADRCGHNEPDSETEDLEMGAFGVGRGLLWPGWGFTRPLRAGLLH